MTNPSVVAPLSRKHIEDFALSVRRQLGYADHQAVDMLTLLELILPQYFEDFDFETVEDCDMGGAEATTSMTTQHIRMAESCYNQLRRGALRYNFTLAHELGHLLIHCRQKVEMARGPKVQLFRDPEWQANAFASAFLMPEAEARKCTSIGQLSSKFKVTPRAAEVRASALKLNFPTAMSIFAKRGPGYVTRAP